MSKKRGGFYLVLWNSQDLPGGSVVKNAPALQEMQVQSLGQEDPLEEEMTTYSSILAWWATVQGVTKSQTQLSD